MVSDRPVARMTLRQLMTQAGRLTRDISELASKSFQTRLHDLHDLSRPTRRKSQYPQVVALQNGVQNYAKTARELFDMLDSLDEHIQAIRDQALRARYERG